MPKTIEAPTKHTKECVRFMATHKAKYTRFIRRYPNYCKACGGYGFVDGTDRESMKPDVVKCEKCYEQGLCPRCCSDTLREVTPRSINQERYITCYKCHWREDNGDRYCIPFEKDLNYCICKQFEDYQEEEK